MINESLDSIKFKEKYNMIICFAISHQKIKKHKNIKKLSQALSKNGLLLIREAVGKKKEGYTNDSPKEERVDFNKLIEEIKKKEGNETQLGNGNEKLIEGELGGKTFTQQCADINTLDDLKNWYVEQLLLGLNDEDKASMTSCKDGRKDELIKDELARKAVTESKEKVTTMDNIYTNKYTFEELKAKKLPELHQVCKKLDLIGWSKKSKSDIVNLILKHINK